jgi:sulfate adenylyltransferase subunit 2
MSTHVQTPALTHLDRLEAESIFILRETVAEATNPVMLYSIGKDSAVMLHLAKKAFFPGPLPFPLLHVDTTWKFRDMYALRDKVAADPAVKLIVYKNPEAERQGINPFDHGPLHTDLWKTEGLKQALDTYGFDAAFGGARRRARASACSRCPTGPSSMSGNTSCARRSRSCRSTSRTNGRSWNATGWSCWSMMIASR